MNSISSPAACFLTPSNSQIVRTPNSPSCSIICLKSTNNHGKRGVGMLKSVASRHGLRCNSSSSPGDPAPGGNESKQVLDAFFLGKAFAEALNERIESTVGEFLSTVGRLQAEQQKQVQEFQDEVLERAQKAKEKAAHEAMDSQGLIQTSTAKEATNASATIDEPTISASSSSSGPNDQSPDNSSTDPLLGISIDD